MRIFDFKHLLAIKRASVYDSAVTDNNEYIKKSFSTLNQRIIDYFGSRYLFHNTLFIDNSILKAIDFEQITQYQNPVSIKYVKKAEKLVSEINAIPISKIVLDHKLSCLLLHRGKLAQYDYVDKIETINLRDFDGMNPEEDTKEYFRKSKDKFFNILNYSEKENMKRMI